MADPDRLCSMIVLVDYLWEMQERGARVSQLLDRAGLSVFAREARALAITASERISDLETAIALRLKESHRG